MDIVKLQLPATATVSIWALIAACSIFFGPAPAVDYIPHFFHVHFDQQCRCVCLTDAETALWSGILCCTALQVAAAVLALLLLPSRRHRLRHDHDTEFFALAAAIVGHCLYAAVVCLVRDADPGYLSHRISSTAFIAFLAVGDILSFITLALGGEEQEAAAAAATWLASCSSRSAL